MCVSMLINVQTHRRGGTKGGADPKAASKFSTLVRQYFYYQKKGAKVREGELGKDSFFFFFFFKEFFLKSTTILHVRNYLLGNWKIPSPNRTYRDLALPRPVLRYALSLT